MQFALISQTIKDFSLLFSSTLIDDRVELSQIRMLERYLLWFCPKKRWKTSWIQTAWSCTRRIRSRFSSTTDLPYFRISLNWVRSQDIIFIGRHTTTGTGEFQFCRFYIFKNYRTTFNRSRENTEIPHFVDFLKDSIRMNVEECGRRVIIAVTVLPWAVLLVSLNDPPSEIFELWSKNGSFERTQSISERRPRFLGKVNFFKIALINPFMNRFQNGLLIQRGHVTSEISHHSDIDISKFHSTLFRVIGFFRYAPKISLIRPKFFLLFFSCWFFE